jgi:hypothetical protein
MFARGDRVRLLKPSGNAKTFAPAGSVGIVGHVIRGGAIIFVTFTSPWIRSDYIHPILAGDLEFESDLDRFARGLA